ncbi:hypothetical protein EIP91_006912 [Steccherinum ochraceum]|uniref:DUF6533 domain-containing protein n=1 Tax=Steccherinum ochraceum TaxID=92696 RepID=A0A4R0R4X6_9APHY|nr:hypothetical protein EIP91_006912 [Steccherinum ochraceum]
MAQTEAEFFTMACQFTSFCLISYDYVLTFPYEVERIWQRKRNAGGILYVVLRYSALVDGILEMTTPTKLWVYVPCEGVIIADMVLQLLGMFCVAIFSAIRVWAICRREPLHLVMVLAVLVLSLFVPAVNIYNFSLSRSFAVEDGMCGVSSVAFQPSFSMHFLLPLITRSVAVAGDLLVLILTCMKTWDSYLQNRALQKEYDDSKDECSRFSATASVIEYGLLYFVGLLALNIVSLFLDIFQSDATGSTSFRIVANAITTNLIARFILDLRHGQPWYARTNYEPEHEDMPDIQFAPHHSLMGDMGATLRRKDSLWCDDPSDESGMDSVHESGEESTESEGSMKTTEVECGVSRLGLRSARDSAGSDSHTSESEHGVYEVSRLV